MSDYLHVLEDGQYRRATRDDVREFFGIDPEYLAEEVESLRALLDRAWDRLPEGHTVLRGEILTALGHSGCTDCGYDCTENPCTAKRDDLRAAPSHAKEGQQ